MIRNRLSELLSERSLKISRVAKEVGIARSSLTAMVQNDSDMIRYDAIDKLCTYLNITPQSFFEHIPLNFEFNFDEEPTISVTDKNFLIDFIDAIEIEYFQFDMLVDVIDDKGKKSNFDLEIAFKEMKPFTDTKKALFIFVVENESELNDLKKYVDQLTAGLKNVLFKKIQKLLSLYVSAVIKKNTINHESIVTDISENLHDYISKSHSYLISNIFEEY